MTINEPGRGGDGGGDDRPRHDQSRLIRIQSQQQQYKADKADLDDRADLADKKRRDMSGSENSHATPTPITIARSRPITSAVSHNGMAWIIVRVTKLASIRSLSAAGSINVRTASHTKNGARDNRPARRSIPRTQKRERAVAYPLRIRKAVSGAAHMRPAVSKFGKWRRADHGVPEAESDHSPPCVVNETPCADSASLS